MSLNNTSKYIKNILITMLCIAVLAGCSQNNAKAPSAKDTDLNYTNQTYTYSEYTVKRNGLKLHLDCMTTKGAHPKKDIRSLVIENINEKNIFSFSLFNFDL